MRDDLHAFCARCAGERPLLVPPCADGHGGDCPERCCADCGSAYFLDPYLLDPFLFDPPATDVPPAPVHVAPAPRAA